MATYILTTKNELYHYGVKGMKWGKRKARGPSVLGSRIKSAGYTLAAKNYGLNERTYSKMKSSQAKTIAGMNRTAKNDAYKKAAQYRAQADQLKAQKNSPEAVAARKAKAKKAVKVGVAVAGTALAAYGAYKISQIQKEKKVQAGKAAAIKQINNSYNSLIESVKRDSGNTIKNARVYDDYGYYEYVKDAMGSHITRHDTKYY